MNFVPDKMALRKVRNNLDRLFDKNLTDLIRGIRNNKENEARYIAACIEEIKVELRQESTFVKANAIEKLAYLQMLGYDISWASFNIIEKRIGYLCATQCFNDETDVLMLTTNMIRKDLQSSQLYDTGVALSGLACFATADLSRDLVNDVVNLLSSSRPYVRKKAVLLLYKIFLKYPECLRPDLPPPEGAIGGRVQSAAVNVICELARKNPRNYLSLAPVFFKLMTTSSNNWMLIKIIKLFGSLVPLESRLGRNTSAMSLLYECINTVIAVLISISSEGPGDHTASIQLCVQKLGVLIEDSDQNLKYLGLLAMGRILQTHPKAVQAHKDIVLRCLDDKDESIRLRALDLLYGMVSKKNIMEIVKKLMEHVDAAEGSFYRDELLSRIISICSYNNYQHISNFEWYISVLVELTKVEGSKHGVLIGEQIQDVTVRVQWPLLVENAHLLLSTSSSQRKNICEVLLAAAWICGEYAEHVCDIPTVLGAMLRIKLSLTPGNLLSVYVQNIAKLYAALLVQYENADDWDEVDSRTPPILEAQERACNLLQILTIIEQKHAQKETMGEAFAALFEGELNPVAAKAQRRVPVPEGLNLDEWIVPPEAETESEEAESDSGEFPSNRRRSSPIRRRRPLVLVQRRGGGGGGSGEVGEEALPSKRAANKKSGRKAAEREQMRLELEARKRREFELENNPYYVKSTTSSSNKKTGRQRVIGLDRYLEREKSTLSWRNAKKEEAEEKRSSKKPKGKSGQERRRRAPARSNTPSRRSRAARTRSAPLPAVVHQVNRGGEMPENALSSDEEATRGNGRTDEFKALDMDLDAPLRDDEKLFAPRPYAAPEIPPLGGSSDVFNGILPSDPKPANGQAVGKKPKKKAAKKKAEKLEGAKKKAIKSKKARPDRPREHRRGGGGESRGPEGRSRGAGRDRRLQVDRIARIPERPASGGRPPAPNRSDPDDIVIPEGPAGGVNAVADVSVGFQPLAGNGRLTLSYMVKFADAATGRVSMSIRMRNDKPETIRRLEIDVLETEDVKLEREGGVAGGQAAVLLPFELPARSCNEQTLHLHFNTRNTTHRIRASLTYFVENSSGSCRSEKIDCRFSSYEYMVGSGELLSSATPTCESERSLRAAVDGITTSSNFSVVEFMDDAVTLYAHDSDQKPVCVMIKKKDKSFSVSCKCADRQLAQSVVEDIIDVIRVLSADEQAVDEA
ncbi:AP-3 complex subunit delta [Aphelenchoides fujianensis]|nr:AP-3 complex subunit delta [Aphelenchoides fujianensis]